MSNRGQLALDHIFDAIIDIETLTSAKSFDDYMSDRLLRRAVERCIEVISEASRDIDDHQRNQYPEGPWRSIRDIGNVIRHGYQEIDDAIIWHAATQDALALKPIIANLLAQYDNDNGGQT